MADFLIGAYGQDAGGTSPGILRGRSHDDGRFEYLGVAAEVPSPSWLALDGDRLYATLEEADELAVFAVSDGSLVLERRAPAGGRHPCHLGITDGAVIAACYGDGVVAVHHPVGEPPQLLAGDGSGPLPAQEGPHAHHVLPLGPHVLTVDLGADLLYVHAWSGHELRRIDSIPVPPGTGPRDLLSLPDGRLALLGEWSCELLLLEPMGESFEVVQILALPGATPGEDQTAALGLSADGRFVFAGIRGADRVASIALDADAARAVGWAPSGGRWPRHLVVDGGFVHVANQLSNTVATLRVENDGTLTPAGDPAAVPSPTHLLAVGAGRKF